MEPDPSPEEREALHEAVKRLSPRAAEPWSVWWREGVRENVADDAAEVQ